MKEYQFYFNQIIKFGPHNITSSMFDAYQFSIGGDKHFDDIDDEDVRDVYKSIYWDEIKAEELPVGLDFFLFEYSVHSGPIQAIKSLQKVLKSQELYNGNIDGVISHQTLKAINEIKSLRVLLNEITKDRIKFLKKQKNFKKDWIDRANISLNFAINMFSFTRKSDVGKDDIREIIEEDITEEMGIPTKISNIKSPQNGIAGILAGLGISVAVFRDLYEQIEPILNKIIEYNLGIHPTIIIGSAFLILSLYIWYNSREYQ